MPLQQGELMCLANKAIAEQLKLKVEMYQHSQKDRLASTFRRALRSVKECTKPIRTKESAMQLKGVGNFVATFIENFLRKENLLNVEPALDELGPELVERPLKKTDISKYVPRFGSSVHFVLLSTVIVTCYHKSSNVDISDVIKGVSQLTTKYSLSQKKLKEAISILITKELLIQKDDTIMLTEVGEQLGKMCIEESRTQYPFVESFIQQGYLDRLHGIFDNRVLTQPVPFLSQPMTSTTNNNNTINNITITNNTMQTPSSHLDLPAIQWPLPPSPLDQYMGECNYKKDDENDTTIQDPIIPTNVSGQEEDWDVLLCLDNREIRSQNDRNYLENQLRQVDVNCEVRNLSLGDMQWILKHHSNPTEVMLNYIVERKSVRDLAQSIMDGRYTEQQYRLSHCGIQHPIYLVEGSLRSQDVLPADSLQTGIMNTIVNRHIYVYQSTSIDDTITFLKELHDIIKSVVHNYFLTGNRSCLHPQLISYTDFQNLYVKTKGNKVKHIWCKQLRQIPRCTVAKTMIIVKHYPTLMALLDAYNCQSTLKEKEDLLKYLCDKNNQNAIGASLSRNIYHYFCDK